MEPKFMVTDEDLKQLAERVQREAATLAAMTPEQLVARLKDGWDAHRISNPETGEILVACYRRESMPFIFRSMLRGWGSTPDRVAAMAAEWLQFVSRLPAVRAMTADQIREAIARAGHALLEDVEEKEQNPTTPVGSRLQ